MAREAVFYSFHFDNDAMRVQQVRNIGMIEDNAPVSVSDWENIRRKGEAAIRKWIDDTMAYRRCVVVLVGSETADRRWVRYEIEKAWNDHRGLFGIYVHNLKCPRTGTCRQGSNPFSAIKMDNGRLMSDYVSCHDPGANAYGTIARNMQSWVDAAIAQAKAR